MEILKPVSTGLDDKQRIKFIQEQQGISLTPRKKW